MNKGVPSLLLVIGCLASALSQGTAKEARTLALPGLAAGTRVELVWRLLATHPSPTKRLELTRHGRSTVLRDLNDLKGVIHIEEGNAALRFARLRTAYSTWNSWDQKVCEVEVVSARMLATQPNYGLEAEEDAKGMRSGYLGVLSPRAFEQGGFSVPKVVKTRDGYSIERWLLVADFGDDPARLSIEKVRENVARDGGYKRTVLRSLKPPQLPATDWMFPENA